MRRLGAASALFLLLVTTAPSAVAGPNTALQHFEAGRTHKNEKRCDLAVKEFRLSIESEPNVGAWLNLADCLEMLNDLQAGYEAYRSAQALAAEKRDERMPLARSGAERMEAKAVRLSVRTSEENVKLEVDRVLVPPERWQHILLSPKVIHRVVARGPGGTEFVREVSGRAGEVSPELVVVFPKNDPPVTPPPAVGPPVERPVEKPRLVVEADSSMSTQRVVGIVITAAGLAGLAVGGVFGLMMLSAKSDLDVKLIEVCGGDRICPREKSDAVLPTLQDAQNKALLSTVFLVSGGVVAVTGLTIALLGGKSTPVSTALMKGGVFTF